MTFLPIFEPARWAPKANESVIEYWASLSPVAPLFGVAWRFGDMAPAKARVSGPVAKAAPVAARPAVAIAPVSPPVAQAEIVMASPAPAATVPAPAVVPPAAAPEAVAPRAPAAAVMPVAANGGPVHVEVARKPDLALRMVEAEAEAMEDASDAPLQVSVPLEAAALPPQPADTAALSRPATLLDAPPVRIDDLKMIKGVGPKLERELNSLGIYTFAQVAGFSLEDLAWVDSQLSIFKGRPFRDNWIDQARALMTA